MAPAKKAPAKRAAPKKSAPAADVTDVGGKFAGYTRDANGNYADPLMSDFQTIISVGGKWFGVPTESDN